jgi:predicted dehydrogenase
MDELKVGIIGCGVIAPSHVDSYRALEGVAVTAFCDRREDRLDRLRARYPELKVAAYRSVGEFLEGSGVDAVSVCTGHASHAAIVAEALLAGKHVICEKPLTTTRADLDRMLEMEREAPTVTACILQHRFDPVYRELKAILESGQLGTLINVSCQHQCERPAHYYTESDWRGKWASEGGSLLINQSIHFLDILQWLGGGVSGLKAFTANLCHPGVIETEDCASLALSFRAGALGSFIATSGSHRQWESAYQFIGSEGSVFLRNGKLESLSHREREREASLHNRLSGLVEPAPVPGAKAYYGTSHPAQIRDFVDCIRSGRRPFVAFADAAEALGLILEAYAPGGSAVVDGSAG